MASKSWSPLGYLDASVPPRLLAAALTPRDRALIAVLYYAGLRAFEAASLDVADVDLERKRLRVTAGKGGTPAVLTMGSKLVRELARYLPSVPPDGPLFPSRNRRRNGDRRITRWTVWETVKRCALRAELDPERVWSHLLRQGMISHLLEAGVPVQQVRELARHGNVSTTGRYARAHRMRLAEAVDAL